MSIALNKQNEPQGLLMSRRLTTPERRESSPYFVLTMNGKPVELVTRARADGRENLPESGAREPNEVETTIAREHDRQHVELIEQTRNQLRDLTADFEALEDQLPKSSDLTTSVADAMASLEHDLAADQAVSPLRREQQQRRRDLRAFIREHRLTREARYPASLPLHLGIIAVVLVAESAANAAFFAEGSALWMVGGFIQAVGVSLVNVISGLLTGFLCLRGLNLASRYSRLLAGSVATALGLFAVAFNLAVANYRDLGVAAALGAPTSFLRLLRSPLDLSLPSVALLAMGLIVWVLSLWKGFGLDDPVPDYGAVHRRFVAADLALVNGTDALRRQVLGHVEAIPNSCRAIVGSAEEVVKRMQAITTRAHHGVEAYEARRAHLEDRAEVLLRRYRDENRAVRTTPEPAYFDTFPTFPSEIDLTPVEQLVERLEHGNNLLDEIKAEEHRLRLGQIDRIHRATKRLEGCLAEQHRRADAGRGDGSECVASNGSHS